MFEDFPKNSQPGAGKAEDIFSEVSDVLPEPARPSVSAPKDPAGQADPLGRGDSSGQGKKPYFLIGALIFIFAGLGTAGFWAYKSFFSYDKEATEGMVGDLSTEEASILGGEDSAAQEAGSSEDLSPIDQGASDAEASSTAAVEENKAGGVIGVLEEIEKIKDTDGDGLPDAEENILGTDPENIDTDNDGLFDREEAVTYKTDPLNPDTDGDTYIDGVEVRGGYNPLGSGKLYDLNSR